MVGGAVVQALHGEIGMSSDLDELGAALYNGTLPSHWARKAPQTQKKLASWMVHFERRDRQYRGWALEGEPRVVWLAGFHIPGTFLAALVQAACREKGWPLDKSTLFTECTRMRSPDAVGPRPAEGCYVCGLYLEGASWDFEKMQLRRSIPKVLVVEMPVLRIVPMELSKVHSQNTISTPVYVTQHRRDAMGVGLVFEADIPSAEHPSHWILQGLALCLNTDS